MYNKNKNKLLLEEKNLAAINEEFIQKMLEKSSLAEIEKETSLLSQFNEKLSEVNALSSSVKEAQAKKQIIKEELARLVEPESLNFYLRRIDPCDTPILINRPKELPFAKNYVFIPASFYFLECNAANIRIADNTNSESNIAYFPSPLY